MLFDDEAVIPLIKLEDLLHESSEPATTISEAEDVELEKRPFSRVSQDRV